MIFFWTLSWKYRAHSDIVLIESGCNINTNTLKWVWLNNCNDTVYHSTWTAFVDCLTFDVGPSSIFHPAFSGKYIAKGFAWEFDGKDDTVHPLSWLKSTETLHTSIRQSTVYSSQQNPNLNKFRILCTNVRTSGYLWNIWRKTSSISSFFAVQPMLTAASSACRPRHLS